MDFRLLPLCVLCLLSGSFPRSSSAEPGDELTVYLMTMGPGDAIYEKFGHNTIRIVNQSSGVDLVFNWGMFDFDAEDFFVNFLFGRLDYWAEAHPYQATVNWYKHQERDIRLQELNLSAAQKVELARLCQYWDGRTYRYNYYTDNCSTRVRDILDEVLDGQLKAQLHPKPSGTTWRWHTRRLTRDNVFWYTALNTVLGPAVDRPISQWEEGFLPVMLSRHVETVTIDGAPLVKRREVVYQSRRPPEADRPPNWIAPYFLFGAAMGGLMVWLTRPRRGFVVTATAYAALIGLCGGLGLWAWFFTAHWAAWRNENLFGYSPIALPLAVLLPLTLRQRPRGRQVTRWLAVTVAASTLIGFACSPMLPQVNAEPIALVLPINVALAWGVWRYVTSGLAAPQAAEIRS